MEPIRKIEIPIDVDNEASILSNAIKNNKHRELFTKIINYLDFRYKENQVLAWTIQEMERTKLACDIDGILVKALYCPVKFKIDYEFVSQTIQNFAEVPEANFRLHITKLKTDKVKEELSEFYFRSIYTSCLDPHVDIAQLETRINFARDIIQKNGSTGASQFLNLDTMVDNFILNKGAESSFRSTGFPPLDEKLTDGYKAKGITVICGLPGAGKSSYALSSMFNLSHAGVWCPQFALEMDSMAITTKLAAFSSGIGVKRIAKEWKNFTDLEKKLLDYELTRLRSNPYILCNDTPGQSLQSIREQILILQDRLKVEYLFVTIDLFGKIKEFQTSDNFARNYEQELNKTQVLAKELGVNLGLVAQINREVMKRKFNRPKMSDLKNAGAWEEVADLILGVHRPFYDPEKALADQIDANENFKWDGDSSYQEDELYGDMGDPTQLEENMAELIVMKQRMGEGNTITNFIFDPNTTRYVPITQVDQMYVNFSKKALSAV